MDEKEKITAKIKKLLNLAGNNPNKEEAQAAMLKAQELLLQYKIEMHEVESTDKVKIKECKTNEGCNTPWARQLAHIIADNFRCMMCFNNYRNSRTVVYFGEEDDAEVACGMYDYAVVWLNKSACNYATMMRNKHGITKGVKQDYILGFLQGLKDKFAEQIKQNECYALAVVVPKTVKEYVEKQEIKKVTLSNTMNVHGSQAARVAGYNDGKNFGTNYLKSGN
jgi:hypothetical protein